MSTLIPVNTLLATKDGRKIGNALVTDHNNVFGIDLHEVTTDYGNVFHLAKPEVEEMFWTNGLELNTHKHFKK